MPMWEQLKGKQKTLLKNVPYRASCGSCCQGNPSKFLSKNTLNCLSQPGFNLVSGKETKTENKQDNMVVKPIGEREREINCRIKHLLERNIFHVGQIKAFQSPSIVPPLEEPVTSHKWERERSLVSVIELMVLQIICLLENHLLVFSDPSWKGSWLKLLTKLSSTFYFEVWSWFGVEQYQ